MRDERKPDRQDDIVKEKREREKKIKTPGREHTG